MSSPEAVFVQHLCCKFQADFPAWSPCLTGQKTFNFSSKPKNGNEHWKLSNNLIRFFWKYIYLRIPVSALKTPNLCKFFKMWFISRLQTMLLILLLILILFLNILSYLCNLKTKHIVLSI